LIFYQIDTEFLTLPPQESKTYYIKSFSYTTALNIDLKLYNENEYLKKELHQQIVFALFFGALFVLIIYNLFLYYFTRYIAYLYYVLYIFGMAAHQLMLLGIGQLYVFNSSTIVLILNGAVLNVSFPLFFATLFTRELLNTKKYLILDKLLIFYIIILPIISFLSYDNMVFDSNVIIFIIPLAFILVVVGIRAFFGGNKLAKLYLLGWSIFLSSFVFLAIRELGLFNIFEFFPTFIEFAIIFEAVVFSVALAQRINILQSQKQELVERLDERELLMKELNHRVKNNMQLIVSLLRLQANNEEDKKLVDSLKVVEHRIQAMSHLHELLYSQDTLTHIDMTEYIKNMVSELSSNFDPNNKVYISLHVDGSLPIKQAVYLGLILNEILTNAYKYAFKDRGNIDVEFTCKDQKALLHVKDDGVGFEKDSISPTSLGMTVIKTLIEKQLKGKYTLNAKNGTSWKVEFKI